METIKQELIGKVVSDVCDKTITIEVVTYKKHPLYGKRVKNTKKYSVHDEENKAHTGDTVRVKFSRPISKTKRYVLDKVLEKAVIID